MEVKKEWYDRNETMRILDVSDSQLAKLAQENKLERKSTGKSFEYSAASIERYANTPPKRQSKKWRVLNARLKKGKLFEGGLTYNQRKVKAANAALVVRGHGQAVIHVLVSKTVDEIVAANPQAQRLVIDIPARKAVLYFMESTSIDF